MVTFVQSYSYNRPFDGSHNVEVALSENEFDTPDLCEVWSRNPRLWEDQKGDRQSSKNIFWTSLIMVIVAKCDAATGNTDFIDCIVPQFSLQAWYHDLLCSAHWSWPLHGDFPSLELVEFPRVQGHLDCAFTCGSNKKTHVLLQILFFNLTWYLHNYAFWYVHRVFHRFHQVTQILSSHNVNESLYFIFLHARKGIQ